MSTSPPSPPKPHGEVQWEVADLLAGLVRSFRGAKARDRMSALNTIVGCRELNDYLRAVVGHPDWHDETIWGFVRDYLANLADPDTELVAVRHLLALDGPYGGERRLVPGRLSIAEMRNRLNATARGDDSSYETSASLRRAVVAQFFNSSDPAVLTPKGVTGVRARVMSTTLRSVVEAFIHAAELAVLAHATEHRSDVAGQISTVEVANGIGGDRQESVPVFVQVSADPEPDVSSAWPEWYEEPQPPARPSLTSGVHMGSLAYSEAERHALEQLDTWTGEDPVIVAMLTGYFNTTGADGISKVEAAINEQCERWSSVNDDRLRRRSAVVSWLVDGLSESERELFDTLAAYRPLSLPLELLTAAGLVDAGLCALARLTALCLAAECAPSRFQIAAELEPVLDLLSTPADWLNRAAQQRRVLAVALVGLLQGVSDSIVLHYLGDSAVRRVRAGFAVEALPVREPGDALSWIRDEERTVMGVTQLAEGETQFTLTYLWIRLLRAVRSKDPEKLASDLDRERTEYEAALTVIREGDSA